MGKTVAISKGISVSQGDLRHNTREMEAIVTHSRTTVFEDIENFGRMIKENDLSRG